MNPKSKIALLVSALFLLTASTAWTQQAPGQGSSAHGVIVHHLDPYKSGFIDPFAKELYHVLSERWQKESIPGVWLVLVWDARLIGVKDGGTVILAGEAKDRGTLRQIAKLSPSAQQKDMAKTAAIVAEQIKKLALNETPFLSLKKKENTL